MIGPGFCIVLYPDCVLSILTKLTKIVVISSDLISRCKFIYHVRFFHTSNEKWLALFKCNSKFIMDGTSPLMEHIRTAEH